MIIYINNLFFNHYENLYVKAYFKYFDDKYIFLNYKQLNNYILNECYNIIYVKINL